MNLFVAAMTKAQEARQSPEEREQAQQKQAEAGDDSTQKVADAVTRAATGHGLSPRGKKIGGPVVHYSFAALMGGVYGATAEYWKPVELGAGTGFATALYAGGDLAAVPALGLSGKPTAQPASSLAEYWAAHLVYGVTLDLVRRRVRKLI